MPSESRSGTASPSRSRASSLPRTSRSRAISAARCSGRPGRGGRPTGSWNQADTSCAVGIQQPDGAQEVLDVQVELDGDAHGAASSSALASVARAPDGLTTMTSTVPRHAGGDVTSSSVALTNVAATLVAPTSTRAPASNPVR